MADQDYPTLYADMEASAQRTRGAAIAFEHVIGGPASDMVPVNGYPAQPTIAGRIQERLSAFDGNLAGPSKNLVNPASPEVAKDFRPNNTTGALLAAPGYNTTGFIPVTGGLTYSLSSRDYLVWYTAAKVYISGTNNSVTALSVVAPVGAAFARASAKTSAPDLWSGFQIEQSAAPTMFEPYGTYLQGFRVKKETLQGDRIAPGTLSIESAQYLVASKNLYNKHSATLGIFMDATTGTTTASPTYNLSDFIPVVPGQSYYGAGPNPVRFHCFFDSAKNFVAGGSNSLSSVITVPATAAYVRLTISATDQNTFQFEKGTAATAFVEYSHTLVDPTGAPIALKLTDLSVTNSKLVDGAVGQAKTDFLRTGKNLFNKAAATIGAFINPTSGTMAASASFDTSDMIRVTAGSPYKTSQGIRFSCYFAANGTTVVGGGINDNTMATTDFTPPAGAVFVRISFGHANLAIYQVEASTVATPYEAFGWKVQGPAGEKLIGLGDQTSTWSGKAWASLGDSITQQAKWQAAVVAALGLAWTNFGVGGTKVSGAPGDANAMCQDTRINAIPATQDLISVMGGTNDWAQNVAMGTVDSVDPLTFNGALNVMITKLMARFPEKRVVLFTTPYGELPDRIAGQGWANAYTNSQGLTTRDYAEAVRSAGKRWGLPCADINSNAGWNTLNIRTFITDDGGLLHPNDAGGKRIAEVAVGVLRNLAPLL